jgi:hypothetical protein
VVVVDDGKQAWMTSKQVVMVDLRFIIRHIGHVAIGPNNDINKAVSKAYRSENGWNSRNGYWT